MQLAVDFAIAFHVIFVTFNILLLVVEENDTEDLSAPETKRLKLGMCVCVASSRFFYITLFFG